MRYKPKNIAALHIALGGPRAKLLLQPMALLKHITNLKGPPAEPPVDLPVSALRRSSALRWFSAMASSDGSTVRPNMWAVALLMTSSNLVDCTTGRSSPLRIRPV
jgi:hypothetical protein